MNAARVKAMIATVRADLDDLEKAVDAEAAESGADSPWMTVADYAKHAKVHPDTVRRTWIPGGLPHAKNPIRINRDEADAWRRSR